jgi:hypothetical protein
LIQYDIEEHSILKHLRSISTQHDIEESSISNISTSISLYPDIEETSISKFKTLISLYPDIEDFSMSINAPSIFIYDIESFELRYQMSCSSILVFLSLGCCSLCLVLDTYCRVHYLLCIKCLACGLRRARPMQRHQVQEWRCRGNTTGKHLIFRLVPPKFSA